LPKRRIIGGLDVGSTKVLVIIAEVGREGEVTVLGVGECPAAGLRKGVIVDIDHTARAITFAMEQAERVSGIRLEAVYVGVTGPHISSVNNRGVVAVAGQNKEVGVEDTRRVLEATRVVNMPPDRRIIHVIPRQFIVDGYDGVVDPVGMSGSRLEVESLLVTAAASAVQNLLKAVQRAGVQLAGLVLNPLASAEAVLQPAERELGCVVVDVGGGTTELAVFQNGSLWFTSVLPVGGDHVTSDLAMGLRVPLNIAEELKKNHGSGLPGMVPDQVDIEITSIGGNERRRISRRMIASIIEPRLRELFGLVGHEIRRSGYRGLFPGGVVLTGGASILEGAEHLAAQELDMPVRLGMPRGVSGLADLVSMPRHATAVGLVMYGAREVPAARNDDPRLRGILTRVRSLFREFF